jgi:hypothetical protein
MGMLFTNRVFEDLVLGEFFFYKSKAHAFVLPQPE